MIKKNDLIEIDIEDFSDSGEGIGHFEGLTFFVKDSVIGDRVKCVVTKMKKTYGYARVLEILAPAPSRVEADCEVAKPCGGCQLRALSYEAQLKFKEEKVKNCLTRIGKLDLSLFDFQPIIGMEEPAFYRNKAQFPFGVDKDGQVVAGFYAVHSHRVVPVSVCRSLFEGAEKYLEAVLSFIRAEKLSIYDEETCKGLVRHLLLRKGFASGEVMAVLVINGKKLKNEEGLVRALSAFPEVKSIQLNFNTENTNVILGNECRLLYGREVIYDNIGDLRFGIGPLSFFQVNPIQTEKLYNTALEFAGLSGNETVWDLYCGLGTISLFLAKAAKKVYGVEIVPEAIENAKKNAAINGITNAEFFVGDAATVYKEKKCPADVIVVDPPRKGLDEALITDVCEMAPEKIVYVSCDPATLARDLALFTAKGYEVKKVKTADLFPMTVHVETVVLLSKKKATDFVVQR